MILLNKFIFIQNNVYKELNTVIKWENLKWNNLSYIAPSVGAGFNQ